MTTISACPAWRRTTSCSRAWRTPRIWTACVSSADELLEGGVITDSGDDGDDLFGDLGLDEDDAADDELSERPDGELE